MAKIGLIDVDGHNYPNLALMKISAYHKEVGDEVEWYTPFTDTYDIVYKSKVFSFTPDYDLVINAKKVIQGGTGYAIFLHNGKEEYHICKDRPLPPNIEKMRPDYSIYPGIRDTAYGFLTRGCPRGCGFCIVGKKEGRYSVKVADVSDIWQGEKNIVLMDPNILASRERRWLLIDLADTKSFVDFNQGLDARLITEDVAEDLYRIKMRTVHFAWDRYQDKETILRGLRIFQKTHPYLFMGHHAVVYTIVNYDSTFSEDLERIYTLRDMGYAPYVMVYNKQNAEDKYLYLSRWVNNRFIFSKVTNFEDYANNYESSRRKSTSGLCKLV